MKGLGLQVQELSLLHSLYPRSSASWKWKNILAPIWKKWREESYGEVYGNGLIVKKYGRIWKA